MDGAVVIGVRTAAAEGARVGYLAEQVPVTAELLALADPVDPLEVFRFGAPCAESGCAHFADSRCSLVERVVEQVPVAVSIAPPCSLRRDCRWWHQEGTAACLRCPLILTRESGRQAAVARAAQPVAVGGSA